MPNYDWVCFRCDKINPSQTEACVHCGFSASATGRSILANAAAPMRPAKTPPPAQPPGLIKLVLLAVSGLALMVGGAISAMSGHWSAYMPPQLDWLEMLSGMVSERFAAVVVGVMVAILGLVCLLGALVSLTSQAKE